MALRLHELARELGLKSSELASRMQEAGLDFRPSALAEIRPDVEARIKELLAGGLEPAPLPSILLAAVVRPIETTADGDIIEVLQPAWESLLRIIERDPDSVFQIDPRKWEEIIAASYERAGFDEVILTPRSGDLGRDVIAVKRGLFSIRIIDQVKAYAPGRLVRADDVRALLGVLHGERNTSKGVVTTTSDFAPRVSDDPFIKPFIPFRLELINGTRLLEKLQALPKNGEPTRPTR